MTAVKVSEGTESVKARRLRAAEALAPRKSDDQKNPRKRGSALSCLKDMSGRQLKPIVLFADEEEPCR